MVVEEDDRIVPTSGRIILKLLILLVIFPAIAYLVSILTALVLAWPMMFLPESAQGAGIAVFKTVTVAAGLLGGFLFAQRIWPARLSEPGTDLR